MSSEQKGHFIAGFICAVLLMIGLYYLLSFVFSLVSKSKEIKIKKITITPEDVDMIREALVFSRINFSKLYENNGSDYQKAWLYQVIALQKQLTGIANQSSAIIEVSK